MNESEHYPSTSKWTGPVLSQITEIRKLNKRFILKEAVKCKLVETAWQMTSYVLMRGYRACAFPYGAIGYYWPPSCLQQARQVTCAFARFFVVVVKVPTVTVLLKKSNLCKGC